MHQEHPAGAICLCCNYDCHFPEALGVSKLVSSPGLPLPHPVQFTSGENHRPETLHFI